MWVKYHIDPKGRHVCRARDGGKSPIIDNTHTVGACQCFCVFGKLKHKFHTSLGTMDDGWENTSIEV